MKKTLFWSILTSILLAMAAPAQAAVWTWTANGDGLFANGFFSTAGQATSPELITSISGQYNGHDITGLTPMKPASGSDYGFNYDQLFSSVGMPFNNNGLLFNVADVGNVNFYSIGQSLFSYDYAGIPNGANQGNGVGMQFSAVTPVPEPETYAMLLIGLGLLGFTMRSKKSGGMMSVT